MDETWVHHYTPENKQQSKQWVEAGGLEAGGSAQKKAKSIASAGKVMARKQRDLRYDLLGHPPYSPDLAPSDFHLFPNLKKFVSGKHFASNEEVERAVDEYFNSLPESHFREGVLMLEKRWIKCVEVKGDYVEK
ncbi:PREDICTED: histone-lysine N-methyltransferase SETMAR-like [Dinoponera quadriceps]|uniref:Histone-lysine N-methyltransferase SETMAR-like n=1 Tax=Dinoponera quadriceps TaxID=609295 RepID=A0A6P3XSU2_DINQU|nr:PREDICTED: histone-lysine N-methyltransferase SETMAR-like [Dinoponera quadriceps]